MAYYGRGKSLQTGYLAATHPFVILNQNCGIMILERSEDGKTALIGSILNRYRETQSTTTVYWSEIQF